MYWCAIGRGSLYELKVEGGGSDLADVDPHRAEETLLVTDLAEARRAHQGFDAALRGIALERGGDVRIRLRVAVEDPSHRGHHRAQVRSIQRGGKRAIRLAE